MRVAAACCVSAHDGAGIGSMVECAGSGWLLAAASRSDGGGVQLQAGRSLWELEGRRGRCDSSCGGRGSSGGCAHPAATTREARSSGQHGSLVGSRVALVGFQSATAAASSGALSR